MVDFGTGSATDVTCNRARSVLFDIETALGRHLLHVGAPILLHKVCSRDDRQLLLGGYLTVSSSLRTSLLQALDLVCRILKGSIVGILAITVGCQVRLATRAEGLTAITATHSERVLRKVGPPVQVAWVVRVVGTVAVVMAHRLFISVALFDI